MDKGPNLDKIIEQAIKLAGSPEELVKQIKLRPAKAKKDYQIDTSKPVVAQGQALSKIYKRGGEKIAALDTIDFKIHQGEMVAIVGVSGSGKSTLLNMISGLDTPTEGEITVLDTKLNKLNPNAKAKFRAKHLGFVFQFFYLQPFLDLQTNVEVADMFAHSSNRQERHQKSAEIINTVGMSNRLNHKPKELSGGQMQRAAIARALFNRPQLLLADEPTGNLDSQSGHDVMQLFKKARDDYGATVIIVTHDQKLASVCDRIIEIKDGKIV